MGNLLKEVFNNIEVMESFNVEFSTQEDSVRFQEALQKISSGEVLTPIAVSGIKVITPQKKIGNDVYSQPTEGKVTQFFVGAAKEPVKLQVKTARGEIEKTFLRTIVNNGFIVEYKDNPLLDFKLRWKNDRSAPMIQVSVFKDQADSVARITETYEELYDIVRSLFDLSVETKETAYIRHVRDYWRRVKMIEEITNSVFDPKDNSENNETNINRLYLLFCEKETLGYPFREFSQHVARKDWEIQKNNFRIGQQLQMTWERQLEFLVFGQTIYASVRQIVPDAEIKEIIDSGLDSVEIVCLPLSGRENQIVECVYPNDWNVKDAAKIIKAAKSFKQLCQEKFYS